LINYCFICFVFGGVCGYNFRRELRLIEVYANDSFGIEWEKFSKTVTKGTYENDNDFVWHKDREKAIYLMSVEKNIERVGINPLFDKETFCLNIDKILNDIKEYLFINGYGSWYRKSNFYVYGVDCYNELENLVLNAGINTENNNYIDRRAFFSFIVQKKLMKMRIKYLNQLYNINDIENQFDLLVEKFTIIMNLVLKTNITKSPDQQKRIIKMLNENRNLEHNILVSFIRHFESITKQ